MSDARILIVDDEEDLRDVLAHQLKKLNVAIDTAENGRAALAKAKENRYDAILSDISMPEMTGLQLLAQLRTQGIESPFVILTGFGDKAKTLEALRLGAFDFLEKPWEPDQVRATMAKAVEFGVRIRTMEADLEKTLSEFTNLTPEQREDLKARQKAILVMRIQRDLISKKVG